MYQVTHVTQVLLTDAIRLVWKVLDDYNINPSFNRTQINIYYRRQKVYNVYQE